MSGHPGDGLRVEEVCAVSQRAGQTVWRVGQGQGQVKFGRTAVRVFSRN